MGVQGAGLGELRGSRSWELWEQNRAHEKVRILHLGYQVQHPGVSVQIAW